MNTLLSIALFLSLVACNQPTAQKSAVVIAKEKAAQNSFDAGGGGGSSSCLTNCSIAIDPESEDRDEEEEEEEKEKFVPFDSTIKPLTQWSFNVEEKLALGYGDIDASCKVDVKTIPLPYEPGLGGKSPVFKTRIRLLVVEADTKVDISMGVICGSKVEAAELILAAESKSDDAKVYEYKELAAKYIATADKPLTMKSQVLQPGLYNFYVTNRDSGKAVAVGDIVIKSDKAIAAKQTFFRSIYHRATNKNAYSEIVESND